MYDDMYSRRKQLASGEQSDVYQYESLPDTMRERAWQIAEATLGNSNAYLPVTGRPSREAWSYIAHALRRVRGKSKLVSIIVPDSCSEVKCYLMTETSTDYVLDAIELVFRGIQNEESSIQNSTWNAQNLRRSLTSAIAELNYWFRREQIGYQFENGQIVRIDSQYVHSEVVKPALLVLTTPDYAGANAEFLAAHEHYRHGRHKECLGSCSNAFESTMKIICELRGWQIENNATASKLIKTCLDNNLLPKFSEQQLTSVRTALESGVPTIRNKRAGHGQGSEIVEVPPHFASYALHLTAANILLLVEAEKSLPR